MSEGQRAVELLQQQDYRVAIRWDPSQPPIVADESPPLGQGAGPTPSQLLLAAVGNCMTDSLLFALRKFRLDAEPLSARVDGEVGRNAEGRLRVLRIEVRLTVARVPEDSAKFARVLSQFEQFCTVGQSVAQGIPVRVSVTDPDGRVLHDSGPVA